MEGQSPMFNGGLQRTLLSLKVDSLQVDLVERKSSKPSPLDLAQPSLESTQR